MIMALTVQDSNTAKDCFCFSAANTVRARRWLIKPFNGQVLVRLLPCLVSTLPAWSCHHYFGLSNPDREAANSSDLQQQGGLKNTVR